MASQRITPGSVSFDLRHTSTLPLIREFPFLYDYAVASALNDVGFDAKRRLGDHARRVFRNPRPITTSAGLVYKKATKHDMAVTFGLKDRMELPKAGTAPDVYLRTQERGGTRVHKRFEKAILRRFPQFGQGTFFIPARQNKQFLDRYGQLQGGKVTQMLSHLGAFPEQGYRANIKNPDKALYFPVFRKGDFGILPPGIYKRDALGSENFEAVVFAVKREPKYSKRFHMTEVVRKASRMTFGPAFSKRFQRMAARQVKEYNISGQNVVMRRSMSARRRQLQAKPGTYLPGAVMQLR